MWSFLHRLGNRRAMLDRLQPGIEHADRVLQGASDLLQHLDESVLLTASTELVRLTRSLESDVHALERWLEDEPLHFSSDTFRADANPLVDVYTAYCLGAYALTAANSRLHQDAEAYRPAVVVRDYCTVWLHWTDRYATLGETLDARGCDRITATETRSWTLADPRGTSTYPLVDIPSKTEVPDRVPDWVRAPRTTCEAIQTLSRRLHDVTIHLGPDRAHGCTEACQRAWWSDAPCAPVQVSECRIQAEAKAPPEGSADEDDPRYHGQRLYELACVGGFAMARDADPARSDADRSAFQRQWCTAMHALHRLQVLLQHATRAPCPVPVDHPAVARVDRVLWDTACQGVRAQSAVLMTELRSSLVTPRLAALQLHLYRPLNTAAVYLGDAINVLPPPAAVNATVALQNGLVPASSISRAIMDCQTREAWLLAAFDSWLVVHGLRERRVYVGDFEIPPEESEDGRAPRAEIMGGAMSSQRNSTSGGVQATAGYSRASAIPVYVLPWALLHSPEADWVMTTPKRGPECRRPIVFQWDARRWVLHRWTRDDQGQWTAQLTVCAGGLAHALAAWMTAVHLQHDGMLETGTALPDMDTLDALRDSMAAEPMSDRDSPFVQQWRQQMGQSVPAAEVEEEEEKTAAPPAADLLLSPTHPIMPMPSAPRSDTVQVAAFSTAPVPAEEMPAVYF